MVGTLLNSPPPRRADQRYQELSLPALRCRSIRGLLD